MKYLIIALVSLAGLAAQAARGYGESGCGLGSIVMGKDGNQILGATTNGTSGSQTFGITTGTSNCTDDGAVRSASEVPMFIEINKATLAKDAARGQGETITGLAQLMGCNAENLAPVMKTNYNKIFVETDMQPTQIQKNIEQLVQSNRSQACGA